MKQRSDEESVMRRYLLGDLDEQMMDEVEVRLLRDNKYAEKLSVVEDNLIDDYVFDNLSEPEEQSFVKNFVLTDERRNKILTARALGVYIDENPQRHPIIQPFIFSQLWHNSLRFLQSHKLAITFSILAIAVSAALFVPRLFRSWTPNGSISSLNAQRSELENRIRELNLHNDTQPSVRVRLQPLVLREGNEIQKLTLTKDTKVISIDLQLPPDNRYEKYQAVVETVGATELFAVENLKTGEGAANNVVTFKLTADILPYGDYVIQLFGGTSANTMSEVARYNLRILPQPSA